MQTRRQFVVKQKTSSRVWGPGIKESCDNDKYGGLMMKGWHETRYSE